MFIPTRATHPVAPAVLGDHVYRGDVVARPGYDVPPARLVSAGCRRCDGDCGHLARTTRGRCLARPSRILRRCLSKVLGFLQLTSQGGNARDCKNPEFGYSACCPRGVGDRAANRGGGRRGWGADRHRGGGRDSGGGRDWPAGRRGPYELHRAPEQRRHAVPAAFFSCVTCLACVARLARVFQPGNWPAGLARPRLRARARARACTGARAGLRYRLPCLLAGKQWLWRE